MLIVIILVSRDLPQVSPTTTDTNFKLYDSCMPYMACNKKARLSETEVEIREFEIVNKKKRVQHLKHNTVKAKKIIFKSSLKSGNGL